MKCPKCHYISFDEVERCRNCGYDFTFTRSEAPGPELPLREPSPVEGPAGDFPLASAPARSTSAAAVSHRGAPRAASAPSGSAVDLPLFNAPVAGVDDTPLLTAAAPPRAPLAVRRSAAETPRSVHDEALADPAREAERVHDRPRSTRDPRVVEATMSESPRGDARALDEDEDDDGHAGVGRRIGAALIDLLILGGTDATVLYFTLRLTGLDVAHILDLPAVPLAVFLLLLNAGYLVGFTTASGQTIGKMLTGIRVVGERTTRVPLGASVVRAAATLLTVLSLGIGYLPALVGRDRRALHDRLARTRVMQR